MAGPFLGETEARRESLRTVFYEVCPQGREKLHVTPGNKTCVHQGDTSFCPQDNQIRLRTQNKQSEV